MLHHDLVCRHHNCYWNAVSADQFGEQTAIRIVKGNLKGMTQSPELVSEWIDSFPVTAHVSDHMDHIYDDDMPTASSLKPHKEELKHRRSLDAYDRNLIYSEVEKYSHPLEDDSPHLYNPVTGQIASAKVNVSDSLVIGEKMERQFIASLPEGFYNPISSPVVSMCISKKNIKDKKLSSTVIDMESIFLRLLMIGQQRQMEIEPLFSYELCAVPPSLIDEHRCLRKGNKSDLVKRLGVPQTAPSAAEAIIVDVSQLFYHIVWPHGGTSSDVVASIRSRLNRYSSDCDKIIVFDK